MRSWKMKVQRLIKKYKKLEGVWNAEGAELARQIFLQDLEQLDKPQPVKVKKFVADFIAEQKKLGHTLSYSIDASMSDIVAEWYWDNSELFALAWIFGKVVEKGRHGKLYTLTIRDYGVFVVTKDVYEKVKVGDEVML
ncbi:DUF1372 family protein [Streptococcus pseudopneumoniae]|uniref:DUF1372 family protein n=1 Tax=Streptococcus pseudopneumoniae TaxID=257758 RepID=UPI003133335E